VKRFAKILLIVLGVLVALFLGGAWFLNRWLQSPKMHVHIERELSKATRVPLKFESLSISPWGGISATGISVPDVKGNFFEASRFTARYKVSSLFAGTLVFSEINVDGPKFVVTQQSDGGWKAPPLPADLQAELDAKKKPKSPKAKPEKDAAPATPKPTSTPKPKKGPDVLISKLQISGGAAELYDQNGAPFATLSEIKLILPNITEEKFEGMMSVGYAVLYGKLAMRDIRAGVSHSEEKGFISPNFSAAVGGGKLSGSFATMPQRGTEFGMPYSGRLTLVDVDVARAATEAGAEPPNLTGTLSGNLTLKGVGNHRSQMQGKGSVILKNGTFREIEMIRQLGEFLNLEEVAQFGIQDATLDFQIGNDRLFVQPLTIVADPLVLSATGSSRLDGKMNLDAVLSVDEEFLAKRGQIAGQFGPVDANRRRSLKFDVNGTWTKPKSNLLERVTGTTDKTSQKIIVGESVLRRAMEEVKKEADERKKEEKNK
jgi:type II secretion system protein N